MYITGYPQAVPAQKGVGQASFSKEQFLKLLTIEMQHQDIFNPQDNSQFMSQVIEMTLLEQMYRTTQTLTAFYEMEQQFQSAAFLGKTVRIVHEDGTKTTGVVKAVKFTETGPRLHVAGEDYSLTQVEEIWGEEGAGSEGTGF